MARTAKVCRGTWCMAFGFDKMATLEQVSGDMATALMATTDDVQEHLQKVAAAESALQSHITPAPIDAARPPES